MSWRHSLRAKIVTWSFVPTAIILAAVALFTFRSYQQVTERLVIDRNRELIRLSASRLSTEMARFAELLDAETHGRDLSSGDVEAQQRALQDGVNRLAIFDGGVVVLDDTGTVAATEPYRPEIVGEDWSNREYFRALLRSSVAAYSNVLPDGPDGAEVVAIAVPIINADGEFVGGLVGMFRVDARTVSAFYGSLAKLRLARSGRAYLLDGTGTIVYHTDIARIGELRTFSEDSAYGQGGTTGAARTSDIDGEEVVASYAPVPGTDWTLITEEPWQVLISTALGYRQFLLVLLALGMIIPAIVVAIGVERITTPIEALIEAAKEVAGGNFERELAAESGDELDELAEQFNRMSGQLRESYSLLEQRVADRTRELEALNTIAQTAGRSLDLDEVLTTTLNKVLEVLAFEAGVIYLTDGADGELTLACSSGLDAPDRDCKRCAESSALAARSGKLEVANGSGPDGSYTFHTVASIPLAVKSHVHGVLTAASRRVRDFEPRDLELLTSIGNQIGVSIENARLYEQAHHIAMLEERQRIARDLHDAVSQTLFSASMLAEVLPRLWGRDEAEGVRRLTELRELTRGAQAEMRTLLLELRPHTLLETSMHDLLKQLAEAIIGRARLPIDLEISGTCPLPDDAKVALYRITQEALNNISKHAAATAASVKLHCGEDAVTLEVRDNGRGFDTTNQHTGRLGLSSMRERAREIGAALEIESTPDHGTAIHVKWPRPAVVQNAPNLP